MCWNKGAWSRPVYRGLTCLWEQYWDYAAYCAHTFKNLLVFPDRDQAAEQPHHLPEYFQKEATFPFTGQVNTILWRLCLSSGAWVKKEQFSVTKKFPFSALSCLWSRGGCRQLKAGRSPWGADWGWGEAAQLSPAQRGGCANRDQRLKSHQRLLLMLKNERRGNGCTTLFLVVPFINYSVRQFLWARQEKLGSWSCRLHWGVSLWFQSNSFPFSPTFTGNSVFPLFLEPSGIGW